MFIFQWWWSVTDAMFTPLTEYLWSGAVVTLFLIWLIAWIALALGLMLGVMWAIAHRKELMADVKFKPQWDKLKGDRIHNVRVLPKGTRVLIKYSRNKRVAKSMRGAIVSGKLINIRDSAFVVELDEASQEYLKSRKNSRQYDEFYHSSIADDVISAYISNDQRNSIKAKLSKG